MAYSSTNPPSIIAWPMGRAPRLWAYNSTDTIATVASQGYFVDGFDYGMSVGDPIFVAAVEASGSLAGFANGSVTLVSTSGPVTVTFAQQSQNPDSYDLFLIAGQSNAEGRGDASASPDMNLDTQAYEATSSSLTSLDDPVGGASTGSAWPAFANQWVATTGRGSIFVETAVGGSGLLAAARPASNWSDTGSLKAAAETAFSDAQSYIASNHPDITINNKYVLWCQGEAEAQSINGTTITGALYQAALEGLIDDWEADLGITTFAIFRTGTISSDTTATNSNWKEIRDAQDAAQASRSSKSLVVFRGAVDFPNESKMADAVHYNQDGLNEMGASGALNLALGQNDSA